MHGLYASMLFLTKYESDLILLSYPFKFMSCYLYFPNHLKDIKDHI